MSSSEEIHVVKEMIDYHQNDGASAGEVKFPEALSHDFFSLLRIKTEASRHLCCPVIGATFYEMPSLIGFFMFRHFIISRIAF